MLVVIHEMGFAREVADRIIYIDEGQIIEAGPPEHILSNTEDARTGIFLRTFTRFERGAR